MSRKKVREPEVDLEEPKASKEQQDSSKTGEKFGCSCGKWYGSLAAVHTHINNKHAADKKQFKRNIINPKKIGQAPSNSIRMKDIQYPEDEAQLMCHADITLKNIYEKYKAVDKNILIDVTEDLSDSDSQIDQYIREIQGKEKTASPTQPTPNLRKQTISQKVNELKEHYKLNFIDQYIQRAKDLQSFTISKFKLNLIRELSKFFKQPFAAKVEFSLQLIHTSQKLKEKAQEQNFELQDLQNALEDVWNTAKCVEIKQILVNYYSQWNEIRFNFANWKQRQARREREEDI